MVRISKNMNSNNRFNDELEIEIEILSKIVACQV